MTQRDYWEGIRDGLYLALSEARLERNRDPIIRRLKELVDMVEERQFQKLRQLLALIGR